MPAHGAATAWIGAMIKWARTFGDETSHDFTASLDGQKIGRIYKTHMDHWQWFAWLTNGGGESGVADTKAEAVEEIKKRA